MEAYIGEYASGKSEVAVNRALELKAAGRQVTLVDLDIVEPAYTLRPLKKILESKGLRVIAWETKQLMGLGETGNILHPAARWALRQPGDIILDVGYGVEGAKTINLLEGAAVDSELRVLVVVNVCRPVTASVSDVVEFVSNIGRVDGLINNTHLGDETTIEVVQKGALIVTEAAQRLGIPVVATTAIEEIAKMMGPRDAAGNPVRSLKRYMPQTLW